MQSKKYITPLIICSFLILLSSCTGVPRGVNPITDFNSTRYLGKWYEIARLDHSFERGLTRVTAEYTPSQNDYIKVLNKGYNPKSKEWKQIEGKAYFADTQTMGELEVVFFWPFMGSYNIIDIDKKNYSYAMVCGYNREYLWILSRTKTLDKDTLNKLLDKAEKFGFNTNKLIFVEQI